MLQYEQIGEYTKIQIFQHVYYVYTAFAPVRSDITFEELLAISNFVIDTTTNKIVKCRIGTLEDLIDDYLLNKPGFQQRDHLSFAIKLPKEDQFDCHWYNEQLLSKEDIVNWARNLSDDCVEAGDGNSYNTDINNTVFKDKP